MPLVDLQELDVDKWTEGASNFGTQKPGHPVRSPSGAQIDVLGLVERFGADAVVGDTRRRARCRLCRSRKVRSLVRLKIGRKDLAGMPVPPRIGR